MPKKRTEKQTVAIMVEALCKTMHLTEEQLKIYMAMRPTLQPWEVSLVEMLLKDREKDRMHLRMLECRLEYELNIGDQSPDREKKWPKMRLPPGYSLTAVEKRGEGGVKMYQVGYGTVIALNDKVYDADAALYFAYNHDKERDRFRWRPVSELPPSNELLAFACANWAHSVQLGKDVPVKVGYREETRYRIFGGSWEPTHWCYPPEAPAVEGDLTLVPPPIELDEVKLQMAAFKKALKAREAYNQAMAEFGQVAGVALDYQVKQHLDAEVTNYAAFGPLDEPLIQEALTAVNQRLGVLVVQ